MTESREAVTSRLFTDDYTWPRTVKAMERGATEDELLPFRRADALDQIDRMNRAISGDAALLDEVLLRDATASAYYKMGRMQGRIDEREKSRS